MAITWSPTTWSRSATAWPAFARSKDDGFVVRMDTREADLYGQRVLALLRRARKTLCEKYGVDAARAGDRRDFPAAARSSPCGRSACPGPTVCSASASAA